MTTSELKPCPFCGHPPYNDEQTAHVFGFRTKHDWAIACSNCEVSAPGAKTLSDAITAWNTRAAEAARRHAIGGKLLRQDIPALYACTARDSGRPVAEVIAELEGAE